MDKRRARAEGIPLKGNFYWSAMDNLERPNRLGTRFGLVYVDFRMQKRTPKLPAVGSAKRPSSTPSCWRLCL